MAEYERQTAATETIRALRADLEVAMRERDALDVESSRQRDRAKRAERTVEDVTHERDEHAAKRAEFASEARSLRVQLEEARAKIHDLASEAAELRGCLSQAEVPLSIAQEERDAAIARVAEVKRERDYALREFAAHNCVCDDPPRCPVFAERDDARRVAKRLAGNFYSPTLPTVRVAVATALAYEVEP